MTDVKRVEQLKKSAPMRLIDLIIIAALTVAALVLSLTGVLKGDEGSIVKITHDGQTQQFPLSDDTKIQVGGLTVVIEDGSVFVQSPSCPDGICEKTGKISRNNESIVCLPGGVVISVEGEGEFDISTGQQR